ncbi:MAG: DnaA/Hda family protein [Moraxella sp.]|nr:DnaA/Hda family protein [Moraxella sp.]
MSKQQLSLPLEIVSDASLHDFHAPGFVPVLNAIEGTLQGQFRELYLFGERGTGKSHLLSAIYTQYNTLQKTAIFLPLAQIIHTDPQALTGLEMFNAVLLDDIQHMIGRRDWQEALFHLINRSFEHNTQLILTANAPLRELGFELLDLSTRLGQMLTVGFPDGSDLADRKALLQSIQRQKGWQFPDSILEHLLNEGPSRTGDILKVLTEISPYFTHLSKSALTKKALEEVKHIINEQSLLLELEDIQTYSS